MSIAAKLRKLWNYQAAIPRRQIKDVLFNTEYHCLQNPVPHVVPGAPHSVQYFNLVALHSVPGVASPYVTSTPMCWLPWYAPTFTWKILNKVLSDSVCLLRSTSAAAAIFPQDTQLSRSPETFPYGAILFNRWCVPPVQQCMEKVAEDTHCL